MGRTVERKIEGEREDRGSGKEITTVYFLDQQGFD